MRRILQIKDGLSKSHWRHIYVLCGKRFAPFKFVPSDFIRVKNASNYILTFFVNY